MVSDKLGQVIRAETALPGSARGVHEFAGVAVETVSLDCYLLVCGTRIELELAGPAAGCRTARPVAPGGTMSIVLGSEYTRDSGRGQGIERRNESVGGGF
jgi:hypothetical protein